MVFAKNEVEGEERISLAVAGFGEEVDHRSTRKKRDQYQVEDSVPTAVKMASQTQGIQQLLAAEKRAAEKVSEARKRKARRLKQAKEEAQDEIEKYRQEREKQFKEFEAKVMLILWSCDHMGSREDVAARIEADTKVKIDEMNKQVTVHKEQVIQKILELVYDIKPELHQNYAASISK
uniref:V-type proton ATPase subunit G n=1 Tax=Timema poppense TaxID=170557 RepID=A0A7R9GS00_TIMPO|nr:unnamed protein product [Timema poppensis]